MTTSSVASPRFTLGRSPRGRSNPGRSYLRIVWEVTSVPLSLVLFAVSTVLVALGLTIDAAVTAVPLLLNVLVTAGLEARAKHRLDQLRILSAPTATVTRDGLESRVDPSQLVQGDHVVIGRGDQIWADGEVVDGEIEVDESLVTITVDCGTPLVVLLAHPDRPNDHRPVLLAIAMAALYALVSALPLARSFFDLEPLPITDAIALALLAGAWALALLAIRRLDLPAAGRRPEPRHARRPRIDGRSSPPGIDRIG